MQVHRDLSSFVPHKPVVVTVGTFDGVHPGHRKILDRLLEVAHSCQGETVVCSFHPHPRHVLFPDDHSLKLLSTPEEKIALFAAAGIQQLVLLPFTKAFSQISYGQFVKNIIVDALQTHTLVIGYDHRFGKDREGDISKLQSIAGSHNFNVEEIPALLIDEAAVSSSKIRKALHEGRVDDAAKLAGRPYSVAGVVERGDGIGRNMGFPTANINPQFPHKLIPDDGVYAVTVHVNGVHHKAMLNIGFRPTIQAQKKTIEAHLFNFDGDLYDQSVTIYFHQRIRKEQKFSDINDLKNQLTQDQVVCQRLLAKLYI